MRVGVIYCNQLEHGHHCLPPVLGLEEEEEEKEEVIEWLVLYTRGCHPFSSLLVLPRSLRGWG